MGMRCNMWLKDENGNTITGGSKIQGREGSIDVCNMDHAISLPYDRDTGKPTARRKHDPIGVLKPIDASSPLFSKACCNGSNLKEIQICLYEINEDGKEEQYFRYSLQNAKVISVRPMIATSNSSVPHLEHVALSYETIHWEYLDGHIQAKDSWLERN